MKLLSFIFLFTFISIKVFGQSYSDNEIIYDKALEQYIEKQDNEVDFTEILEAIEELKADPMDINNASIAELSMLPFLSTLQIHNLYAYIQKYGALLSIYELSAIETYDPLTIQLIQPLINISPQKDKKTLKLKNILKYGHHHSLMRLQRNIQKKSGYSLTNDSIFSENKGSYYLGDPNYLLFKYQFKYTRNFSAGFTAHKDPGEYLSISQIHDSAFQYLNKSPKNGFDFYSAHFFIQNLGIVNKLSIGDYHVHFGQGLTANTSISFGKSSGIGSVQQFEKGIRPYRSTNEQNFLRGAAINLQHKNFELTVFFSKNKWDASIDTMDQQTYISSMLSSGLHRTINEINKKHSISMQNSGININYKSGSLKLGFTGLNTYLSDSLLLKQEFYPARSNSILKNNNAGINYQLNFNHFSLFGETAIDGNYNSAHLHGLNFFPNSRISLHLTYRNYHPSYQNFLASGLSEGSHINNEKGLLCGFNILMHKKVSLSGYVDNFKFPWIKYQIDAPSFGNEYFFELQFKINKSTQIYGRMRSKIKTKNYQSDLLYTNLSDHQLKNQYRIHLIIHPTEHLSLNTRFEYSNFRKSMEYEGNGYLIYQDMKWKCKKAPIILNIRYTLFDTDSYDERIYSYESDVLYAFSVPAYYYQGNKFITVVKYDIHEKASLWLRYSYLLFHHENDIGSGNENINGNQKSEIKLQLKLKI